jgi:uncharacterized protein YndB with AHSA1/START domain
MQTIRDLSHPRENSMRHLAVLATLALSLIPSFLFAAPTEPLVTEAVVNAPVEAAWKSWTTKAGLEAWLVGKTEIDLKIGGVWLTNYNKESNLRDDSTIQQTILAFDPGRMLAFRTTGTPANFPYPGITRTWTVLYFEAAGPGKTRVTARMFGFGEDEESKKMRAFFERGNRFELDKMIKFFENGSPAAVR